MFRKTSVGAVDKVCGSFASNGELSSNIDGPAVSKRPCSGRLDDSFSGDSALEEGSGNDVKDVASFTKEGCRLECLLNSLIFFFVSLT